MCVCGGGGGGGSTEYKKIVIGLCIDEKIGNRCSTRRENMICKILNILPVHTKQDRERYITYYYIQSRKTETLCMCNVVSPIFSRYMTDYANMRVRTYA